MKKLIIACFLFIGIAAFAQVKVRPGLRLGLNSSNLSNLDFSSSKTGINAATYVNVRLAGFYQIQPEIGYSNQGAERRTPSLFNGFDPLIQNSNVDLNLELEYLNIALANKFFPIKNVGFHVIIGPSLDILIGNDYNGDIIPIDISFFGGLGYEFPFGLGLEARYKQGIIDVRENYDFILDSESAYYDDRVVRNSVLQFSVYYNFGF